MFPLRLSMLRGRFVLPCRPRVRLCEHRHSTSSRIVFAQTLKPGVSRSFGPNGRWVAFAYYAFGINDYGRLSQYRDNAGVDVTWYPRKYRWEQAKILAGRAAVSDHILLVETEGRPRGISRR
jgi:hypothetical protein